MRCWLTTLDNGVGSASSALLIRFKELPPLTFSSGEEKREGRIFRRTAREKTTFFTCVYFSFVCPLFLRFFGVVGEGLGDEQQVLAGVHRSIPFVLVVTLETNVERVLVAHAAVPLLL